MDLKERINQFKLANPKLVQLTLRISEHHEKMFRKLAKKHNIKDGHYLRILFEDAIERESQSEPIPFRKPQLFSNEELESLKNEVNQLKGELYNLLRELSPKGSGAPNSDQPE